MLCGPETLSAYETHFAYIYRRILARAEVTPSNTGNVTVQDGSELEECDTILLPVLETDSPIDAGALFGSLYLKNATVYIAVWVVQKLIANLKCHECRQALVTVPSNVFQREHHLLRLKNGGGLLVPSDGVVVVVSAVERCLSNGDHKNVTLIATQIAVMHYLEGRVHHLFDHEHFDDADTTIDNHLFSLVNLIVKHYFNLRQHHSCKLQNHRRTCDSNLLEWYYIIMDKNEYSKDFIFTYNIHVTVSFFCIFYSNETR